MKYQRLFTNGFGISGCYAIALIQGDTVTCLPTTFRVRAECDAEIDRLNAKLDEPTVTIIDDGNTAEA